MEPTKSYEKENIILCFFGELVTLISSHYKDLSIAAGM